MSNNPKEQPITAKKIITEISSSQSVESIKQSLRTMLMSFFMYHSSETLTNKRKGSVYSTYKTLERFLDKITERPNIETEKEEFDKHIISELLLDLPTDFILSALSDLIEAYFLEPLLDGEKEFIYVSYHILKDAVSNMATLEEKEVMLW